MNARRRLDRWANVAAMGAVVAYCIAAKNVELAALCALVAGVRFALTRGGRSLSAPRWIVNTVASVAVLWTLGRAVGVGGSRLDIDGFSILLTLLMLGKLFDWNRVRDAAQVLMLAAFLAIGAVLTSNELLVFLTLSVTGVALAGGALWYQLAAGEERLALRGGRSLQGAAHDQIRSLAFKILSAGLPVAMVISVVVFALAPRGLGDGLFGQVRSAALGERVTGFSDRVQLGAGGVISNSQTVVLDMVVTDRQGKRQGGLLERYYLRGAVLDRYDRVTGAWEATPGGKQAQYTSANQRIAIARRGDRTLVQDITIRSAPSGESYIYAMWSPSIIQFARPDQFIEGESRTHSLRRRGRGGKLQYTVESADPPPARIVSGDEADRFELLTDLEPVRAHAAAILAAADIDADEIQRLATESVLESVDKIVSDAEVKRLENDGRVLKAIRTLERHLRENYAYTLDIRPAPSGADPIEWFLIDAREGHCEYFAAGLTAMCRSLGIGARVITGYLATEFNENTEHYVVRESNAHAWVEAEIGPGVWRTFDATPQADLNRIHDPSQSVLAQLGRMIDAVEYAWINTIVGFDESVRSRLFGLPRIEETTLARRMQTFGRRLEVGGVSLVMRAAFNASMAFAATVIAGWMLISGSVWALRRWRNSGRGHADGSEADLLYQAVLHALRRAGHPKPEPMPLGRFASGLAPRAPEVASAAAEAASTLYPVRFGQRPLTPESEARVRELLARLAAAR